MGQDAVSLGYCKVLADLTGVGHSAPQTNNAIPLVLPTRFRYLPVCRSPNERMRRQFAVKASVSTTQSPWHFKIGSWLTYLSGMKSVRALLFLFLAVLSQCIVAQRVNDTLAIAPSCGLLRELVYQSSQKKFAQIIDTDARSSQGRQTQGSWRFTNDVYGVTTLWPGSTKCRVMHYTEQNDTLLTESWQYIADFEKLPDALAAQMVYQKLNQQIIGCPYQPENGSSMLRFEPLPLSMLPPSLPDGFQQASLFELPVAEGPDRPGQVVMVMVGLEKWRAGFRVSLMVDYTKASIHKVLAQ